MVNALIVNVKIANVDYVYMYNTVLCAKAIIREECYLHVHIVRFGSKTTMTLPLKKSATTKRRKQ